MFWIYGFVFISGGSSCISNPYLSTSIFFPSINFLTFGSSFPSLFLTPPSVCFFFFLAMELVFWKKASYPSRVLCNCLSVLAFKLVSRSAISSLRSWISNTFLSSCFFYLRVPYFLPRPTFPLPGEWWLPLVSYIESKLLSLKPFDEANELILINQVIIIIK